jgi:Domain of unknown function (DUF4136)
MSKFRLAGAVVFLVAAPFAFGQKIQTKSYEKVPPGAFSTYHWRAGRAFTTKGFQEDPQIEAMVRKAVEKQMQAKGFKEAPDAPLELSYAAGVSKNLRLDVAYLGDYMMWTLGTPFLSDARQYQTNGLLITVVDTSQNRKAIWAGLATANFKPSDVEDLINKSVEKAFKKFPLTPQKP